MRTPMWKKRAKKKMRVRVSSFLDAFNVQRKELYIYDLHVFNTRFTCCVCWFNTLSKSCGKKKIYDITRFSIMLCVGLIYFYIYNIKVLRCFVMH